MEQLPRSPVFLITVLVLIVAEYLWRTRFARKSYDWRASAASFGIALGNAVFKPLSAVVITAGGFAAYSLSPVKLLVDDWRVWAVAFIGVEFAYYWFHRFSHTVRWMWAAHAVHHTATEMTLPAAIRLSWFNLVAGGWLLFLPLGVMGFHPLMVGALLAANLAYQFILHTEAIGRLGPLEWVLNTPSHHRAHHASNPRYIDRNYGGVLIVFDRLFGTFVEESKDEPLRYGLAHPMTSYNPLTIMFHEWKRLFAAMRAAPSWRAAFAIALGKPPA